MSEDKYTEMSWAELKADCYDGDSCDKIRPYWNVFWYGDKQDDNSEESLVLDIKTLPIGTKVVVSMPVCPECDQDRECCDCGFDWDKWTIDKYI